MNKKEKLSEILIGEAVLALLEADEAISWRALLGKLQLKLAEGLDEDRTQAAMLAIQEVKAEMRSRGTRRGGEADNVVTLTRHGSDSDSTRH
ncbi:hypothetical protein [Pantoea sp. C2G6]|uniref:hypothetical protein n=1 Tax=Pantoea sp. C2G6 TaxID=3243084 RepID=UPI003ED954C3